MRLVKLTRHLGIVSAVACVWGLSQAAFGDESYFVSAPVDRFVQQRGGTENRAPLFLDSDQRKAATQGKTNDPNSSKQNNKSKNNDPPKIPFLRSLFDSLQNIQDKDIDNKQFGTKDDVKRQLQDADELLGRVKLQNKDGIRRANNPPRLRMVPNAPPKTKSQQTTPIKSETPSKSETKEQPVT